MTFHHRLHLASIWLCALILLFVIGCMARADISLVPVVFNTPGAAPSTTVVTYNNFPYTHFGGFNPNESLIGNCIGGNDGERWTCLDWKVVLKVAPGPGASWTFSVRNNGQDTGFAITISDFNLEGRTTLSPSFNPGDVLTLAAIPSVDIPPSPISNQGGISMVTKWEGHGALECTGATGISHTAPGTTRYIAPQYGGMGDRLSEFMPWATSGTFCFARVNHDMGVGGTAESVSYRMQVGTQDTDLFMQVNSGYLSDRDLLHSVHVNRGDLVGWKVVSSPFCAQVRFRLGYIFIPDNPGECVMTGHFYLSTKQFQLWESNPGLLESDFNAPMLECTARCLVGTLTTNTENQGVPAGKRCTQTLRRNGQNTSLTITGIGPTVYWEDAVHIVPFFDGDTLNMRFTNVNAAPGWMHYGITFQVPQ